MMSQWQRQGEFQNTERAPKTNAAWKNISQRGLGTTILVRLRGGVEVGCTVSRYLSIWASALYGLLRLHYGYGSALT